MITRLLQGQENEHRIDLLLKFAKLQSEAVIQAIKLHLVNGYSEPSAYQAAGVPQQNFHRALKRLNEIYCLAEEYREISSG